MNVDRFKRPPHSLNEGKEDEGAQPEERARAPDMEREFDDEEVAAGVKKYVRADAEFEDLTKVGWHPSPLCVCLL
jgi:hypothetical protein